MPLWFKDCFELKAIEKQQQIQEKLLPSLICQRAGHKFVKVSPPSPLYQEEQTSITGDSSGHSSSQTLTRGTHITSLAETSPSLPLVAFWKFATPGSSKFLSCHFSKMIVLLLRCYISTTSSHPFEVLISEYACVYVQCTCE